MFAVPSMNKSFHSNPEAPKSLALSVLGTKSLSNLPVAVIVSEVALPRLTLPFALSVPLNVAGCENSEVAFISNAPLNVDKPETLI